MILGNRITVWTMSLVRVYQSFAKVQSHAVPKFMTQKNVWRVLHLNAVKEKTETRTTTGVQNSVRDTAQQMYEFIRTVNANILDDLPRAYVDFNTVGRGPYLIEEKTAKEFVSFIIDDLLRNTCFVIETFPGFGLLTKTLLNANVPLVHMYEDLVEVQPIMDSLINQFPDRLELRKYNFQNVGKLMYLDNVHNDTQLQMALKGIPQKKWEDDTCMQVITVINTDRFMRQILMSLVFSNCLMVYGRPAIYGAIKPSLWEHYTNKKYKLVGTGNILFNICFNYKKLGEVSRRSYIPWRKPSSKPQGKNTIVRDDNYFYVVKFEPKPDLHEKIIPKQDLVPFWHFLRHNFIPKKKRVIPELEKLIPNCGFKLILKDYNIFTDFHHLSPHQALDLYKEISSWPEFKTSSFKYSVEAVLSKMDENLIATTIYNSETNMK